MSSKPKACYQIGDQEWVKYTKTYWVLRKGEWKEVTRIYYKRRGTK